MFPEEALKYQALISNNAKKMLDLIDSLLIFFQTGQGTIQKRMIKPYEIAKEVLLDFEYQFPDYESTVDLHDLSPCFADPILIRQVYVNLIDNAYKYTSTPGKPQIEIGMVNSESGESYYVKDNGIGFEMQYADRLFKVFQRLHSENEFKGTGIGLATVKRIVNRHGGIIWVESAPGEGTTVFFTIPESA